MTYRISYSDGLSSETRKRNRGTTRTEDFGTEQEALVRVRKLLEEGDHDGVSVCDSSGNVLCGVRLQLKLGLSEE
jgi:hypothetical protein